VNSADAVARGRGDALTASRLRKWSGGKSGAECPHFGVARITRNDCCVGTRWRSGLAGPAQWRDEAVATAALGLDVGGALGVILQLQAQAEQAAQSLYVPDEQPWLDRLEREVDNLRAALDWAIAAGHVNATWWLVAEAAGHILPFEALVDEMLALLDDAALGLGAPSAHDARPAGTFPTPREREALALIAEGRSNKEIAEALFISPNTAKSHVTSLLNKLAAETRAKLVAPAAERELL